MYALDGRGQVVVIVVVVVVCNQVTVADLDEWR